MDSSLEGNECLTIVQLLVEDQNCLCPPSKQSQMDWWTYLAKGEPEIDTQKIEPETSWLSNLDTETRSTVEKKMASTSTL